jgi:uncharacterized repeat protein (TIGR03803 family)
MRNARASLALSVIVVVIAGCAHGGTASSPLPVVARDGVTASNDTTYKVLYSFKGRHDGAHPEAGLIAFHGKLYGTSDDGGGFGCVKHAGCGTVFEVSPSGQERVVYAFKGLVDGAHPTASLVDERQTLRDDDSGWRFQLRGRMRHRIYRHILRSGTHSP